MASPVILSNEMYSSRILLLNVRNIGAKHHHQPLAHINTVLCTVFMYSMNGVAKSADTTPAEGNGGVATTLTGLAHYDHSKTSATTQAPEGRLDN